MLTLVEPNARNGLEHLTNALDLTNAVTFPGNLEIVFFRVSDKDVSRFCHTLLLSAFAIVKEHKRTGNFQA